MLPAILPPEFAKQVKFDSGFLCMTMHWRPKLDDPNPNRPGQKVSTVSFLAVSPDDPCLCGSGKIYRLCCRVKTDWVPLSPNPGGEDFSLIAPQIATYQNVDGSAIRKALTGDLRLLCTDDSPENGFWVYFGDEPVQEQFGTLCFGDLELKNNNTLIARAMSERRWQAMLDFLQEVLGDTLGTPQIQYEPVQGFDKRTRKQITRKPKPRKE